MPAVCQDPVADGACGGAEWSASGATRDERGRCATCNAFPTLGRLVAWWIERHCVVPDRAAIGSSFRLSEAQELHLLRQFRLWPDAVYDMDRPAAPFFYVGTLIVRGQKWGKGPFSAARVCAQAEGPVLFAGWAEGGEQWRCRDYGCSCGGVYTYEPGEPMGARWPTPHIQVAATAEDQTKNIWRALRPMIELGRLRHVIEDTGLDRMNLRGGGVIEPVSSNALTRLGARITYVEIDQPESMTESNRGEALADVLLRNLGGTGGRWAATGNAYDPTEASVEQTWVEKPTEDVYVDFPEPPAGSWANRRDRRKILTAAYKGSPWVDLDRIEAECDRLERKGDPGQAERFYGNRIVAGAAKAFDIEAYKALFADRWIEPGRIVTGGFDGSLAHDHTVLVIEDVETHHQMVVGWWRRPPEHAKDDSWRVPLDELDEQIDFTFRTWNVWRLLADPPRYRDDLNRWAGRYGSDRVVEWWSADRKKTALALREYRADMRPGLLSHGPLRVSDAPADSEALAAHAALIEHHGNAVRRATNMRDEDDPDRPFLWLVSKEAPHSEKKIDLVIGGCYAHTGAGHARRAGVLNEPAYGRASWSGGNASSGRRVEKAEYVPCIGCGKPIHPSLHTPDASERGRCLKCRTAAGDVGAAKW